MFCNTCILFFEFFMCKVLELGSSYYKTRTYFFIFFGLGSDLETDQAFQPLTPPCLTNMAWKDKEWMKVGSKWKCKVDTCIFAYHAKWLLTKHLKEVHGLVVEKAKPRRPSTFTRGLRHQDHAKMNARILGDVMVLQRRNDQKVVNRARAKT